MDKRLPILTAFVLGPWGVIAQENPGLPPPRPPDEDRAGSGFPRQEEKRPGHPRFGGADFMPEEVRKRIESLPPEEREKFRRNFDAWRQLQPEERDNLRKKEREHMEKAKQEMEALISESGLQLTENQRKNLKRRYIDERREMERELRELLQKERDRRLPGLRQKLIEEIKSGKIPDTLPVKDGEQPAPDAPPPPPDSPL